MSKVLIVDDDRSIRELLSEQLEGAGFEVGTSKDGKAALEELDRTEYDLLLLDVLIPHVNGFAVVDELSQDPKKSQIPTILFSGLYKSSQQAGEVAKYPQVVGFLDKPLEMPKLLELVRRYASQGEPEPAQEAPAEEEVATSAPPASSAPAEDYVDNAVQSGLFRIQDVPGLIDAATKKRGRRGRRIGALGLPSKESATRLAGLAEYKCPRRGLRKALLGKGHRWPSLEKR